MMAIIIDMESDVPTAYTDIQASLKKYGFNRQQGSVYFGDSDVDAVACVLAVQELTELYSWFSASVKDIRMLRIEDDNNLMPAIEKAARLMKKNRVTRD